MVDFESKKTEQIKNSTDYGKTIIIVALIFAIAYIFVESGKISYKEREKAENEIKLNNQKRELENCLNTASENYFYNWNRACKIAGKKDDCSLPSYRADTIEKWRKEAESQCMEKFKNGAF